ncbi:D-alanyl-D-alanine endopeptidase [Shewanella sp. WXL01]|uniref:D-alanyl-D-alanine endopeptidase n=1 Tax=Shewanella sp. WXL01 TaxID=2709721 RepID=UPI00143855ED|nr:D-alanyl-D-alanine endopeptidase [Shewanella sp. WXL01]NKF50887.1 D-alanyl-D-alanine endopeptidase [Shewanella sp. WXL01]
MSRFCFSSALVAGCLLALSHFNAFAQSDVLSKQPLAANSVMVVDLKTNKVLHAENADEVSPIASVSKLMAAMVVLDAKLPLKEKIAVDVSQSPIMRNVHSRIRIGSKVTRENMLIMTLIASENRAATSLAHHYPGGFKAFVKAMNAKAKALSMNSTHFDEPSGLSESNVSSASDLIKLLKASQSYPELKRLSSMPKRHVIFSKPRYKLDFHNTNKLVFKDSWDIALTKTGYTSKAGQCLVMLAEMNKREVAFVVLDAFGKYTHLADANRFKRYLETGKVSKVPKEAQKYKQQKQTQ